MYPPAVITQLKEALRNAFWYKDDLRRFFFTCGIPQDILTAQAWHDQQEYKVRIIGKVLDELIARGDEGIGPMRRLIKAVIDLPNFDHLKGLEDGATKVSAARRSVDELRALVRGHDATIEKQKEDSADQSARVAEAIKKRNEDIEKLKSRFNELIVLQDAQKRGILFERFLYDLFSAHDLNPRSSFVIVGEQIDGAFEFEGTQFLLEAKWHDSRIGAAPLDSFSRKVERRLENTLGLFVALNSFTEEGLTAFGGTRPAVILMDGQDLAIVLQGLIDFRDLLKRKVRYASQTGNPFLRASELA